MMMVKDISPKASVCLFVCSCGEEATVFTMNCHMDMASWKAVFQTYYCGLVDTRSFVVQEVASATALGLVRAMSTYNCSKKLATAGHMSDIQLWSLPDLQLEDTLAFHEQIVNSIVVVPEDRLVDHGYHISKFVAEVEDEYRHPKYLDPVQQSVEEYMFSASDDSIVALWSLSKRKVVKDYRHHKHGVNAIEVVFFRDQGVSSSCGSSFPLLISASDDNTVQVVDISSGTVLRTLLGAQDIVFSVAHTYGYVGGQVSLIVFTGSRDKVVRVYNAEEGTCLRCLAEHSGIIRGIRCLGDDFFMSVAGDNKMKLWRADTWESADTITCSDICGISKVTKSGLFVTGAIDTGEIKVWSSRPPKVVRTIVNSSRLRIWRVLPHRNYIIASYSEKGIGVLRIKRLQCKDPGPFF